MKIGIIGLGFVGLSFAAVLGSKKYHVIGIDSDESKIKIIRNGKAPFFEPKLDNTIKKALKNKFTVNSSISSLTNFCDIIFVTVGTPQSKNGSIDLSMIKTVSKKLAILIKNAQNNPIIIIKSTVVPGTVNNIVKPILEKHSGKKSGRDFGLISNPEFLRETQAINDTINPHVVVLGSDNEIFLNKISRFYKKFHGNVPMIQTNSQTAEMIKYANNSFLATKISFINQIAKICEQIPGANVDDIAKTIGLDPRIGNLFLNAGPGYGGSCLPKDVKAIINFSSKLGINPVLLDAVEKINQNQIKHILGLLETHCGKINNKKITILGLAFKPFTDDIRDSISLDIIEKLLKKRAKVMVHDPKATENVRKIFKNKIEYATTISDAVKDSYAVIIMTTWPQYKKINNKNLKTMKKSIIIDSRRILNNNNLKCDYYAIGIGN